MKVGIGYSNNPDSFESGKNVAQTAKDNAGIDAADFFMAFCNSSINADEFFKGVKEIARDTPVIGGSAIGIITNEALSYEGFPSGALAFKAEDISIQIQSVQEIDKDMYEAGKRLGNAFSPSDDSRILFLLYDSIFQAPTPASPPVMNASPPLIAGLEKTIKKNIPLLGAGVVGDYDFGPAIQFCGDRLGRQHALGLMMSGDVDVYHTIMHGCTPIDGEYYTITRKDGPFIHEINGIPASELIDGIYGGTEWRNQVPVSVLTIGVNKAEKYADFEEENYVNRLITGVLPDGKGICMFESDLKEGMEIQFMLRDGIRMIESVELNTKKVLERIRSDNRKPGFGIYIDCGGRASIVSHTIKEEAAGVQQIFNTRNIPLFGFYSGVEIAPFQGKSRGLDWTGVLIVFAIK